MTAVAMEAEKRITCLRSGAEPCSQVTAGAQYTGK